MADEKTRAKSKSTPTTGNRNRRESGEPGGGQGRKDEVGGSGVYPFSGPQPQGPAEIRTQAGWGQGERGAAGYEDSGRSELVYEGGQLLGGLDTEAPGSANAGDEIPPDAWGKKLDDFSHRGCRVSIEQIAGENRQVQVEDEPLNGISADHPGKREKIYISVGEKPDQELTHIITSPRRLWMDGAGKVEIESANGERTIVRCRAHREAA